MYWCGIFTESCQVGVAFIASQTFKPINFDRLRAFFGHYPAGSSVKCWQHWYQVYSQSKFQDYDYGSVMNQRIYGQVSPPELNIEKV